jgi:hypothetical protein
MDVKEVIKKAKMLAALRRLNIESPGVDISEIKFKAGQPVTGNHNIMFIKAVVCAVIPAEDRRICQDATDSNRFCIEDKKFPEYRGRLAIEDDVKTALDLRLEDRIDFEFNDPGYDQLISCMNAVAIARKGKKVKKPKKTGKEKSLADRMNEMAKGRG